MNNVLLLSTALALGLGLVCTNSTYAAPTEGKRPPNVVMILVDDLGWADVGCFGSKVYQTPHIDRLAGRGMKFTNAYAACAVCSPTRAAIMTGRYPARLHLTDFIPVVRTHAILQAGSKPKLTYSRATEKRVGCPPVPFWLDLNETTIAEMLQSAGYATCQVGKWHLGPYTTHGPRQQGFDESYGGCELGQPPSYFDPYRRNRPPQSLWGQIPTLPSRKEGEYLTDREADEACSFIKRHKDRPFFVYLAHYAVHTPLQAKPELQAYYQEKIDALPEKPRQKNATYAAMVHSVDQAVGKVMQTLDELNLTDNTLIIFTGDNGGLLGPTSNYPLRHGKGSPYEGGIREPTIIAWPGKVAPGSVCDLPVTSVDYLPSICQAAGVKTQAGLVIDGVSIVPLLTGQVRSPQRPIYWHFPHYRSSPPYSIVRDGPWKLIRFYTPAGHRFELYNLTDDLSETNELSEKMPRRVKELDARLTEHLKQTDAQLPLRATEQ